MELRAARLGAHHRVTSVVTHLGDPHHRGRDMFYARREADGARSSRTALTDKDLHGEEVDVFVQRDCASGWEKLGTAVTTKDGEHPTVDGVADNGGRISSDPQGGPSGPVVTASRSVVAGDGTYADSFLDIVRPGTPSW